MISTILSFVSAVLSIYTIICFIYIILSWFPGAKFTKFGKIICTISEPYMNFFSRRGWLRVWNVDFSPIISLGILSLVSSILGGIQSSGRISLGGTLGTIIIMIWNAVSSLGTILSLIILIRWIVIKVKGDNNSNSAWYQIDSWLGKLTYNITKGFYKGNLDYKKSLIISFCTIAVILVVGNILIRFLVALCLKLPI